MRISDWSSDVCSSDLRDQKQQIKLNIPDFVANVLKSFLLFHFSFSSTLGITKMCATANRQHISQEIADRKSVVSGKSVSVSVDLGGRRINKKKKKKVSILH